MRQLLDRPIIVVTGKGGTGKSTVAAALGIGAARSGLRTIIAEVHARDDVHRAIGGHEGDAVAPLFERRLGGGLHHVSIDTDAVLAEYLRDQLPKPVAGVLARSRTFATLAAATPGLRELLTIGKVWELAQPDRRTPGSEPYDLVIVDAPATGHGLAVLTAPRAFAETARGGPIERQALTIDRTLGDAEKTAVIAVCLPEELPVNETLELAARLERELPGQSLAAVVVNGMLPRRFSAADRERLTTAADAGAGGAAVMAALAVAERSYAQREQLDRLRAGLGRDPAIVTLQRRLDGDALDARALTALSRELLR